MARKTQSDGGHRQPALMIIGGGEDREEDRKILREFAERAGKGRIVVTTVASHRPEGYFDIYLRAFRDLGVQEVVNMDIRDRHQASDPETLRLLDGADGVFFTGGDQLRITSQIGSTLISDRLEALYREGAVIAGTSAGASAMCETMLVRGSGQESHRIGDLWMAPGLGLLPGVIIDQHFSERGRMGRLLGAVAQNPRVLGVGIDEDTAILVEGRERFTVFGSGAVYTVDAAEVSYSNIAEERSDRPLSIYGVRLHVLSAGDRFDIQGRRPLEPAAAASPS